MINTLKQEYIVECGLVALMATAAGIVSLQALSYTEADSPESYLECKRMCQCGQVSRAKRVEEA